MYLLFHYVQYEGSDLIGWFSSFEELVAFCEAEQAEDEYPRPRSEYEWIYAAPGAVDFDVVYRPVFED